MRYGIALDHPIYRNAPGLGDINLALTGANDYANCLDAGGTPSGCYKLPLIGGCAFDAATEVYGAVAVPDCLGSARAKFIAFLQFIGSSGFDSALGSDGSGNAATLGSYYSGLVSSYPIAFTPAGCPPSQVACAQPFSGAQYTQTWTPGAFYDAVQAAVNAAQAQPLNTNTGTNYAAPAPNATTASSASQATPATSQGLMPGEAQPSPVSGSAAGSVASASAAGCSFALFGDTSCIGPIGTTTALVLGAAALALFLMFGGKK